MSVSDLYVCETCTESTVRAELFCRLGTVRVVLRVVSHDEAFQAWLSNELRTWPFASLYPWMLTQVVDMLLVWRRTLPGTAWRRLWKGMRIVKEINEVMPAALQVVEWVQRLPEGSNVEVVDICSGIGFLSMLLSHLLPADKVRGIWLVDKQWPNANREPLAHEVRRTLPLQLLSPPPRASSERRRSAACFLQISWEHIKAVNWPIPLATRKTDIKDGSAVRNLSKCVFGRAQGPLIMAGIHLCGTLSIKAVQIFNDNPQCVALVLKPCCMPGRKHIFAQQVLARRKHCGNTARPYWELGTHRFTAAELYADDEPLSEQSIDNDNGEAAEAGRPTDANWTHADGRTPPKRLSHKLATWAGHLLRGIDMGKPGTEVTHSEEPRPQKRVEQIMITPWTAQNIFIIGERPACAARADQAGANTARAPPGSPLS